MMQPFTPHALPLVNLDYGRLIGFVGRANAELARYDGLLYAVRNPTVLLSPLTTQEAVLSSRIEGTQATLDEVLEHEAGDLKIGEKETDIQEIVNYRRALILARDELMDRPITLTLVRQMHRILLDSVRGKNKTPGEFRKEQNWIGRPRCKIEEATFIPPSPLQLQNHLLDWQVYLSHQEFDPLVQTAIVHAQFELLHPFNDGNGRIGRLLIPLFLYQVRALQQPMFYLSGYLEEHRDTYYDRLQHISADDDWNGWILFFLEALAVQARDNASKVQAILTLYEEMKSRVEETTRSPYTLRLLDAVFDRPIFQSSEFAQRAGIPKPTALPLLRKLKEVGVLRQLRPASGRRAEILAFPELLNIAEGRVVL